LNYRENADFQFVQSDSNTCDEFNEEPILKQEHNVQEISNNRVTLMNNKNQIQVKSFGNEEKNNQNSREPIQLFLQVQKDKMELMDTFKEIVSTSFQQAPLKQKNHIDLFFESVSSSVKALTPKLIAEAKMRVSQLICELELRALTENTENTSNSASSTIVMTQTPYIFNQSTNSNTSDETLTLP